MQGGSGARIRAIDWLRGLVMLLMAIDHAGSVFDAHHMHGDRAGVPLSPLPAGEFLTRWVTHLCAPTFVLLAGTSLALSSEKRRNQPGQTAFIVKRGLIIAALDPTWMSFGFALFHVVIFQVLYAIGLSLVCMAFLRRLSSRTLLGLAFAIQAFGELTAHVHFEAAPLRILWAFLFVGGPIVRPVIVAYPLIPWLSIMMAGWVLGRWLIAERARATASAASANARIARTMALVGVALLAVFAVVRGVDGYGNWGLYRDSLDPLQWLHVAKYPPSIAYTTLELGIAFVLLALFFCLEDTAEVRSLRILLVFGATAFFFYLLHVHLLALSELILKLDRQTHGVAKSWIAAACVCITLYPLCRSYRRYKAAHPDGWTRYI